MRTAADRLAEIQAIFDGHNLARLRLALTPDVAAEICARPLGPHDDRCARIVRALASAPVAGKLVVVSLGPDGPWGVGQIAIGAPGNLVRSAETFDHHEDAMRHILRRRLDALASGK
jgi:hypothetical protein